MFMPCVYHAHGDSFQVGYKLSAKAVAMIMQYILNFRKHSLSIPVIIMGQPWDDVYTKTQWKTLSQTEHLEKYGLILIYQ